MSDTLKKNILLVEDEFIIAAVEKEQLSKIGYNVIHVGNGEKAVETALNNSNIDLVLMDINLSTKMDGTKAAELIFKSKELPIIFLSSHIEPEIVEMTEKITSYGYVVKNSGITILDASIKMAFKLFNERTARKIEEEKFRKIYENVSIAIAVVALDFSILHANRAYCNMLGYKEEELIGKHLKDFTHPDIVDENLEKQRLLGEGKIEHYHMEKMFIHKDGHIIKGILDANLIRDADNKPIYFLGSVIDVTQQRFMLEKLEKQEKMYRDLFEEHSAVKLIIDPKTGNIVNANKSAVLFYGYPKETLIRMKIGDINIMSPEEINNEMERARKFEKTFFEFKHRLADNSVKDVNVFSNKIVIEDKEYLHSIVFDVTEKMKSERKYQLIFKNSFSGIVLLSRDGKYIDLNPAYTNITGYSRDEMIDKYLGSITHPDDIFKIRSALNDVLSHKIESYHDNLRIINKQGAILWIKINANSFKQDGELEYILAEIYDITPQVYAEEVLKKSEEKYRFIAENVTDVIWVLNLNKNKFTYISPSVFYLRGYTVNEAMEQNLTQSLSRESADSITELNRERLLNFINEPDKYSSYVYRDELQQPCKNGELIWIETTTKYKYNDNNEIEVIGVSRNITERKRDENKIKDLLKEKEIILKEVHHRLKNNMNNVIGFLSIQCNNIEDSKSIDILNNAIARIKSMSLLYDKLYMSDNYLISSVEGYLNSLIDEVVLQYSLRVKITVEKKIDDFFVDNKILFPIGIIINELLTNIIKYAFKGREEGIIKVFLTKNDNNITVIVTDNGVGIPESVSFDSTSGFGLQLVSLLVQQISGVVSIERNNGTKFIIEFKLRS